MRITKKQLSNDMAGCKLTKSLGGGNCAYSVAGAHTLYLANFYPPVEGDNAVEGSIAYKYGSNGEIEKVSLPASEKFFVIEGESNTISFTDALLASGNGGKYRQHTVNAVVGKYDADLLAEADALSLGRFVAIVADNAGRFVVLGRTSGLTAPAGGFDYASGAAEADANGWTVVLQGNSMEVAPLLKGLSAIDVKKKLTDVASPPSSQGNPSPILPRGPQNGEDTGGGI